MHPDQLLRLLNDKPAYSWETKVTRVSRYDYDPAKFSQFISDIKNSQRVSSFVKEKSDVVIYADPVRRLQKVKVCKAKEY